MRYEFLMPELVWPWAMADYGTHSCLRGVCNLLSFRCRWNVVWYPRSLGMVSESRRLRTCGWHTELLDEADAQYTYSTPSEF